MKKPKKVRYPKRTHTLVSPDWVETYWAPRTHNELLAHRKYWVQLQKLERRSDVHPARFDGLMRQELKRELERYVIPSSAKDGRDFEDLDTSSRKRWIKIAGSFSTALGDPLSEVKWNLLVHPDALLDAKAAFRMRLKHQMEPPIVFSRNFEIEAHRTSPAEAKARMLLRDIIGEEAYGEYLRCGFVKVVGPSGLQYCIRGGHNMMEVRDPRRPQVVRERVCVVFKNSDLPHTDSVIMRILLVQNDEFGMRAVANIYPQSAPLPLAQNAV